MPANKLAQRQLNARINRGATAFAAGSLPPGTVRAADFGAAGNGTTDDTGAIQNACNAMGTGGTVLLGPYPYLCSGRLSIPAGVTLQGSYPSGIPRHETAQGGPSPLGGGTALLTTVGSGSGSGPAFVTLAGANAAVRGLVIVHPLQINPTTATTPVPHPFAIGIASVVGCVVENVEFYNAYQGIDCTLSSGGHLFRNVGGQVFNVGIRIDNQGDVTRIENIQFIPVWSHLDTGGSANSPLVNWTLANGVAFDLLRVDQLYMVNCFCFFFAIGYRLRSNGGAVPNAPWVNAVNCGADVCQTCLQVTDTQPAYASSFSGSVFTGYGGGSNLPVQVTGGVVSLTGCTLLSQSTHVNQTGGKLMLNGCQLSQVSGGGSGTMAAITGGQFLAAGCQFDGARGTHVTLGAAVAKASITGCVFAGTPGITNGIGPNYASAGNV